MSKERAEFYEAWEKHSELTFAWKKLSDKNTLPFEGVFNTNSKKLKMLNGAKVKGSCRVFLKEEKNPSEWISFIGNDGDSFFYIPQGFLTMHFPDGDIYSGYWKNGNYYSHGKYFNHKSGTYIGTWEKGQMNGWGEYEFKNGDKYIGEYKNHEMHGLGTFRYADGKILRGYFQKGEFKKELKNYKIKKDDEDYTYI